MFFKLSSFNWQFHSFIIQSCTLERKQTGYSILKQPRQKYPSHTIAKLITIHCPVQDSNLIKHNLSAFWKKPPSWLGFSCFGWPLTVFRWSKVTTSRAVWYKLLTNSELTGDFRFELFYKLQNNVYHDISGNINLPVPDGTILVWQQVLPKSGGIWGLYILPGDVTVLIPTK